MHRPLVSICIPTYNGSRFVTETIQSIVDQNYDNIEILVSDHSSVDDTLDKIRVIGDPRIHISTLVSGGGASANWNAATNAASGDFVKLVCQDDVLEPDCLELQVQALIEHPESTFVFSPRNIISPRGRVLLRNRGFKPGQNVIHMKDEVRNLISAGTNIFGEPCAVLIRRENLKRAKAWEGSYLIDLNMWLQLWQQGPATYVPRVLSSFRISEDSWTTRLKREQSQQMIDFLVRVREQNPQWVSELDVRNGIRASKNLQFKRGILTRTAELLHI